MQAALKAAQTSCAKHMLRAFQTANPQVKRKLFREEFHKSLLVVFRLAVDSFLFTKAPKSRNNVLIHLVCVLHCQGVQRPLLRTSDGRRSCHQGMSSFAVCADQNSSMTSPRSSESACFSHGSPPRTRASSRLRSRTATFKPTRSNLRSASRTRRMAMSWPRWSALTKKPLIWPSRLAETPWRHGKRFRTSNEAASFTSSRTLPSAS